MFWYQNRQNLLLDVYLHPIHFIVNIYKYIYLPQKGCSEVVGAGGEHTNTWDFNNAVVTMSRCKGKLNALTINMIHF